MLRLWACRPPQRKEEGLQTHPGAVAAFNHPALNPQIPGSCCSLVAGTGSQRPGDRTLCAALGQGQAESDRKSRERKEDSQRDAAGVKRTGVRESGGKEDKGTVRAEGRSGHRRGPQEPLAAQSPYSNLQPSLARAAPTLLPAAPPPSRPRAESQALQRPPPALPLPELPLAWTRLEKDSGRPPQPFPPCDSTATARPVSSLHRSRWDLHGPVASSLLPLDHRFPLAPSAAETWAGPTGPARRAGSGAAAMPAGPLPATCSPSAGARAPTAEP